jgi:hypothetical protein
LCGPQRGGYDDRPMDNLSFWIATILIPLLVVGANAVGRVLARKQQSAAADIVLTLIVFDFVVIIQANDFKRFAAAGASDHLPGIFSVFVVMNVVCWGIAVFRLEPSLDRLFDRRARRL